MAHGAPEPPADPGAVERRALALLERLAGRPDNPRFRARLLRREPAAVLARVAALEARLHLAAQRMPTQMPAAWGGYDDDITPPPRVGPFRVGQRIGHGGMGTVWRGERDDGLYEQVVAIKFIHPRLAGRASAAFEAERRILARLEHPGIARIIDGGIAPAAHAVDTAQPHPPETGQAVPNGPAMVRPPLPYLVMEHVAGQPIDEAMRDAPLPERVQAFERAAEAVQFAHGRLVAHADLKPSNILVDSRGQVKLLDFGIARLLADEPATTDPASGQAISAGAIPAAGPLTPAFASPARIAGAPPSIADDIFALGRTLAHVLAAPPPGAPERPSAAATDAATRDARVQAAIADVELAAIVAKATAAAEQDRYPSVAALLADLAAWRTQRPVLAMRGDATYRARKFVARHRFGVAATALAFAALAATTLVAVDNYVRAERERAEAEARYADARGTARFLLFDLLDRLQQQPNSLALRADVARVAQHYLDRLSHARTADASVTLKAATGLWRLAEHQAKQGRPNLRQPAAARANLERAERMAARVPGAAALALRARIQLDRALLASAVDNDVAAAERALMTARATMAALGGGDADLRRLAFMTEANVRGWQGRYRDMIASAEAGLRLPEAGSPHRATLQRANLLSARAEAHYYLREQAAAERDYRAEVALLERAHAQWPRDNEVRSRLAYARWNLGSTLTEQQRFAEAEPILARGVQEARASLAFDPADEDAIRRLRVIATAHAQALGFLRRTDAALAILQPIADRDRTRWQAHPGEPLRLRDYAMSMIMIAEALDAGGRAEASCRVDNAALALFGKLRAMGRLTPVDVEHNLAFVDQRRARNCARGEPPGPA